MFETEFAEEIYGLFQQYMKETDDVVAAQIAEKKFKADGGSPVNAAATKK